MILVTGATGNVGRHVVAGLRAAGAEVRALSRTEGQGLVRGDLTDPDRLRTVLAGVDQVFLLWPGPSAAGIEAAVDTITLQARRVVYLSAMSAENGFWGVVEKAVAATAEEWTFLRAGGFATNTLGWAGMIRDSGTVSWPYGAAARSLVHERDLADVAIRALLEDGHVGRTYELTGPAAVTQAEQVRLIGEAIGRELRWVELPSGIARDQLLREWGDPAFVDSALTYWASLVDRPEPVTDTVERVTGHPARTFAQWARDHADDFR
jgi:uncharacterized protein YbjT (DUF2867 family)